MAYRYLIDTHVLIWLAENPQNISDKASQLLNTDNNLLLSHASIWEMAIKLKIEKLKLELPLNTFVDTAIEKHSLGITPNIADAYLSHAKSALISQRSV